MFFQSIVWNDLNKSGRDRNEWPNKHTSVQPFVWLMQTICSLASCLAINFEQGRWMKLSHRRGHWFGLLSSHFVMHFEQKCVSHSWQATGFHRISSQMVEQSRSCRSTSTGHRTRSVASPSAAVDVIGCNEKKRLFHRSSQIKCARYRVVIRFFFLFDNEKRYTSSRVSISDDVFRTSLW